MNQEEALIVRMAADVLVDGMFADEIAPRCTCNEANILAQLIELALGSAYADTFIEAHAQSDQDEDDTHHDLYLQQQSVVD